MALSLQAIREGKTFETCKLNGSSNKNDGNFDIINYGAKLTKLVFFLNGFNTMPTILSRSLPSTGSQSLPALSSRLIYSSLSYYVIVVTITKLNGTLNVAQSSSDQ